MSDEPPPLPKTLPSVRSSRYAVGYGKPPPEGRFQPGRSGNPKGRPKGARNRPPPQTEVLQRMHGIILAEAYRLITVADAKGPVTIPIAQAVMRSIAVNAVKGLQRAQRLFTEIVTVTEREIRARHDDGMETIIGYKMEWEIELEHRARHGLTGPEPVPHPDHIVLDVASGQLFAVGPMTMQEKAEWQHWQERRDGFQEDLDYFQGMLAKRNCKYRDFLIKDVAHAKRMLGLLDTIIAQRKAPRRIW